VNRWLLGAVIALVIAVAVLGALLLTRDDEGAAPPAPANPTLTVRRTVDCNDSFDTICDGQTYKNPGHDSEGRKQAARQHIDAVVEKACAPQIVAAVEVTLREYSPFSGSTVTTNTHVCPPK
jgi:hypothetical protein